MRFQKKWLSCKPRPQQLLDAVQRLQSTMDARLGVLEHLAQQTADQSNQVSTAVTALQQKIGAQNDAVSGKVDGVSGQVQSLNDSVDELKARIAKLDKSVQDLQMQLQAMQQAAQTPPGTADAGRPGGTSTPSGPASGAGIAGRSSSRGKQVRSSNTYERSQQQRPTILPIRPPNQIRSMARSCMDAVFLASNELLKKAAGRRLSSFSRTASTAAARRTGRRDRGRAACRHRRVHDLFRRTSPQ